MRFGIARQDIVALDLSPANSARLGKRGFKSACGDILALPLDDDVADFTICNGVIHHTPAPQNAFNEIVRITKPDGMIFLAVYNRWNPYFYLVHRATAPIRYVYWRWNRGVLDLIYPFARILFQPLVYCVMGRFLDAHTGKTLLADQVFTPYAHLFSKRAIRRYAIQSGCEVLDFDHSGAYMLLTAILRKKPPAP